MPLIPVMHKKKSARNGGFLIPDYYQTVCISGQPVYDCTCSSTRPSGSGIHKRETGGPLMRDRLAEAILLAAITYLKKVDARRPDLQDDLLPVGDHHFLGSADAAFPSIRRNSDSASTVGTERAYPHSPSSASRDRFIKFISLSLSECVCW
jgi:hypothetical protein